MTRETKVGLAVASSFISLVAIVVTTKFYSNDPGQQTAQVVVPAEPTPVIDTGDKGDKGKKDSRRGDRSEKKHDKNKPTSDLAPAAYQPDGPVAEIKPDGGNPPPPSPALPGLPAPAVDDRVPLQPTPPNFDADHKKKLKELKDAKEKELLPPDGPPARIPLADAPDPAPLPPPGSPPPPVVPSAVVPPPNVQAPPAIEPPPPMAAKDPVPPPPSSAPLDPPMASGLSIKPRTIDPPLPSPAPPGPDAPPPFPSTPPPPGPITPPGPTAPPPGPATPPAVVPVPRASDVPMPPPAPIGANPGPLGAPMSINPPIASDANAPKVRSFDVQPHIVGPDETTFAAISKQVWGTEKYAQALLQFNRDYPNADKGIYQNPPILRPGQKVHIPKVDFLEQHYASAINNGPTGNNSSSSPPPIGFVPPSGVAPIPAPSVPTIPPSGSLAVPTPPTIAAQPQPQPKPASNGTLPPGFTPSTDAVKRYRVPDQGQNILEIAQRTLGDRGRWSEIYRLNPNVQPQFPIPGGTELRLPGNAVVP